MLDFRDATMYIVRQEVQYGQEAPAADAADESKRQRSACVRERDNSTIYGTCGAHGRVLALHAL